MALPKTIVGIIPSGATNAAFRLWAANVQSLILNTGMLQVAVTGNIDFTAVSANTVEAGFDLFQFNDTLQATAPVFFRLGYGGNGTAANPALYLTLGGNHAGNLISTIGGAACTTPNTMFTFGSASLNTNLVSWAAGNASCLMLALWMAQTNPTNFANPNTAPYMDVGSPAINPLILSIERTHDASGNDTTDGVLIFGSTGTRTWQQIYWGNGSLTGMGTAGYELSCGMIAPQTENKTPGQLGFFPNYFTANGAFVGPSLNILHTMANGPPILGDGSGVIAGNNVGIPYSVPILGSNHTYVSFSPTVTGGNMKRTQTGNTSIMVRYE
jgi:hypothetical protein